MQVADSQTVSIMHHNTDHSHHYGNWLVETVNADEIITAYTQQSKPIVQCSALKLIRFVEKQARLTLWPTL